MWGQPRGGSSPLLGTTCGFRRRFNGKHNAGTDFLPGHRIESGLFGRLAPLNHRLPDIGIAAGATPGRSIRLRLVASLGRTGFCPTGRMEDFRRACPLHAFLLHRLLCLTKKRNAPTWQGAADLPDEDDHP